MTEFKDNLKKYMDLRKMTQDNLAHKIDLTRGSIGHYINGRRIPPLDIIKKIAIALETTTEQLLAEEEEVHNPRLAKEFYVVNDSTMEPNFPKGSIIYIDDAIKPFDGAYVIVKSLLSDSPIFRQYHEYMGKRYLKSLGNFPATEMTSDMKIVGVAVKAEIDLMKT